MADLGPRYDEEWEDDTAAEFFDELTATKGSFYSADSRTEDEDGTQDEEPVMSSRVDGPQDMWGQEIVALVRNTVETTRRALQNSLANSGLTEDAAAQTKLTIQLKSQGFREFPAEAVELLKPDVERLVIAHNSIPHIPYKFCELQGLTFLNVRANRLREFPKAFLKLSKLQMLDISRNQLTRIPEEIGQMKALKVLSASGNRLQTVPNSLGSLETLRILKIDNNPLNEALMRMIQECGGFPAGNPQPPQQTQHELEMTAKLKEQLRFEASSHESTGDSSEGPLETPRPLKRNNSLRFPVVIPGLSGSESTPDLTSPSSRSHTFNKAHQRVISGTGGPFSNSRRPGVTPLLITSDRTRSNSEGLLQATQAARSRRFAPMSRRPQDVAALEESRADRNSLHLRGVSHGSGLKDRPVPARVLGRSNLGSSISNVNNYHSDLQFRRLSSLPEADLPDVPGSSANGVQAYKCLLYSLHQMHIYLGNQPNIIRQGTPKRSSLERVYYNATTHLENLDGALYNVHATAEEEDHVREDAARIACEACRSCIVAYKQVIDLIFHSAQAYISQTDPRFVRTFLHILYASIVEATNAAHSLRKMIDEQSPARARRSNAIASRERLPKLTVRQITPIKEKPRNISSRLRSDTFNGLRPSSRMKSSSNPYSAVPLYLNGRSRSNSRTAMGAVPSSATSSLNGTPRSGESFIIPNSPIGLPNPAHDYNPGANADFNNQDLLFEAVHRAFHNAVNPGMTAIPVVCQQFRRSLHSAIESKVPKHVQDAWSRLVTRARTCQQFCEALRACLAGVKFKDPEVRRSPEFWGFCTRYVSSFVRLIDDVKVAKSNGLDIDKESVRILRPVHLSVKAAVSALQSSPWAYALLATGSTSASASRANSSAGSPAHSRAQSKDTPPSQHMMQHMNQQQHYANGISLRTTGLGVSNGATNGSTHTLSARARGDSETSLSPYLPQTPLSAALGPAAQATIPAAQRGDGSGYMAATASVPTTPPKTSFDTSFRGDVFERADTLLRSHSLIGHRR